MLLRVTGPIPERTQMHDTRRNTVDPGRIEISHHAKLRCMERIGVIEQAGEYVRELLSEANPVDDERFTNCLTYRAGDVTIVVDRAGAVVQTVVKEVER